MDKKISGLHHITAIAGDAKRNLNFYTEVLGLKLVKKTVNFDDPYTYHFYFGDEVGSPGTILTFFPWDRVKPGRRGIGMVTEFGFSVPEGSLDFWLDRLRDRGITYNKPAEKFGERYLTFLDPDGLKMELTVTAQADARKAPTTSEIGSDVAIKGFHNATLTLHDIEPTAEILENALGYKRVDQAVNRYRFKTDAAENAGVIDLVKVPGENDGIVAGGTVHHIAFGVDNDDAALAVREKLIDMGLSPTPVIDRNYFRSVYFREPGGVLFEIATREPGFAIDEEVGQLGTSLKLPSMYESRREELERRLPKLD